MNSKTNPLFVGLMAGATVSLGMVVFNTLGILVLIPVLFGPLPVYVAALGWGGKAGIAATLTIILFTVISADPAAGLLIGMTVAAPAALAGFQANLAQPNDEGELEWFPLSRILFWISLLIAAAIIMFGLMLEFDPEKLGPLITENFQNQIPSIKDNPQISLDDITRTNIAILSFLPFLMPSMWIGIHMLNLLLGLRIARRLKVLARPAEDIAANLALPQFALALMVVTLIGTISTSAPISFIFSVGAGAMAMAFSIVGLAAMHTAIRNWQTGRSQVLFITYFSIIIFFIPVYLFSYAGILRTARGAKTTEPD